MTKSKKAEHSSAVSFYSRIREYQRILKSGGSFASGVTIYGNNKRLAVVSTDGIGESIKYIELKNIRAVLIKRLAMAPRAAVLAVLLAVILILTYFGFGEFSSGFVITGLITTMLFILCLLGLKNCTLRIVTDVNDHLIPSVHKYRVAKKLLDFVSENMQPYLEEPARNLESVDVVDQSTSLIPSSTVPEVPISVAEPSAVPPPVIDEEESL